MCYFVYMFVPLMFGYHATEGAQIYVKIFLTFASGFFLARWVCMNEGGLRRVLMWVLVAAVLTVLYVARHGGFSLQASGDVGRAALDVETFANDATLSVNMFALTMGCYVPFLQILGMKTPRSGAERFAKMIAIFLLVVLSWLIVRTGSRNGTLVLIPCILYVFGSTGNRLKKSARMWLGIFVASVIASLVLGTLSSSEGIRAFRYKTEDLHGYQTKADAISSGRIGYYMELYDRMTPMQRLFGAGFSINRQDFYIDDKTGELVRIDRVRAGNVHSIFVQVFTRTGLVGSLLFLAFIIKVFRTGLSLGDRGRIGLLFVGAWLVTGIGESWGFNGGFMGAVAGFGMGLLSRIPSRNSEFGEQLVRLEHSEYCIYR